MNILVVEDDEDICELYSVWLKEKNHQFTIARNCEDGINEYSHLLNGKQFNSISETYDLVVLDYDVPSLQSTERNGLYVAKDILKFNPDQKIMIASAWPKKAFFDYTSSLKSVPEILSKPFEKEDFLNQIEKIKQYDITKKLTKFLRKSIKNPNDPVIDPKLLEGLFKILNDSLREENRKKNMGLDNNLNSIK